MPATISRDSCADLCGPTTGDRVRLAGTNLIVDVGRDLAARVDKVKLGAGRVIRDGIRQSHVFRAWQNTGRARDLLPVQDTCNIGKADTAMNNATPHIEVILETRKVRADGKLRSCDPADALPKAQRRFLC